MHLLEWQKIEQNANQPVQQYISLVTCPEIVHDATAIC